MRGHFISCDWGTSSFRLRLIEGGSLKVIAEIKHHQGIADTYRLWKEIGNEHQREKFYLDIIKDGIAALAQQVKLSNVGLRIAGLPVMLSGMASSTIGLVDIPYKTLPFSLDGSDLAVRVLRDEQIGSSIIVVSGACTSTDVMRGEETKVLGCAEYLKDVKSARLLLPGTHPKHIVVGDGEVQGFVTYMTGEFFDLLAGQSVLAGSVESGASLEDPACSRHFITGLEAAQSGNILHQSFTVRTRQVLSQVQGHLNYFYLSGLLIGTELRDLREERVPLYLVSSGMHTTLYTIACNSLKIKIKKVIDADEALIRGQELILSGLKSSL